MTETLAGKATNREDLQTRMQGNAFLGAFFRVSPFLKTYNIPFEEYKTTVRKQYEKKFGRFGETVVESNMTVMQEGFDNVIEVPYGDINAPDTSNFVGGIIHCLTGFPEPKISHNGDAPMFSKSVFESEFRAGLGYDQPSTALSSVGLMAAATGAIGKAFDECLALRELLEDVRQLLDIARASRFQHRLIGWWQFGPFRKVDHG